MSCYSYVPSVEKHCNYKQTYDVSVLLGGWTTVLGKNLKKNMIISARLRMLIPQNNPRVPPKKESISIDNFTIPT